MQAAEEVGQVLDKVDKGMAATWRTNAFEAISSKESIDVDDPDLIRQTAFTRASQEPEGPTPENIAAKEQEVKQEIQDEKQDDIKKYVISGIATGDITEDDARKVGQSVGIEPQEINQSIIQGMDVQRMFEEADPIELMPFAVHNDIPIPDSITDGKQIVTIIQEGLKEEGSIVAELAKQVKNLEKTSVTPGMEHTADSLAKKKEALDKVLPPAEEVPVIHGEEDLETLPEDFEKKVEELAEAPEEGLKGEVEAPGELLEGEEKITPEKSVHDYGSTQVNLPEEPAKAIKDFGKKISEEDLYIDPEDDSYGREDKPHITVRYGLETTSPKDVEPAFKDIGPIKVKFGKVSIFETDKYGVVKVDVESPDLEEANKKVGETVELPGETFKDYKPHATIAYVKKGEGKKYIGDKSLEGKEIVIDSIFLSAKDGKMHEIKLKPTPSPEKTDVALEGKGVEDKSKAKISYYLDKDKIVMVDKGPAGNFTFYKKAKLSDKGTRVRGQKDKKYWFETKEEAQAALSEYAKEKGFEVVKDIQALSKHGEKAPLKDKGPLFKKPKVSTKGKNVRTLRGFVNAVMGGINPLNFKGEVKNFPLGSKYLFKKRGVPIDDAVRQLKEDGWLDKNDTVATFLEKLRTDVKMASRDRLGKDVFEKKESELTEEEKRFKKEMAREPEAPPKGEYETIAVDDLKDGSTYTIIEGRTKDGWDEYKIHKTKEGVTLEDGEILELEPWDEVQVLKKDLKKPPTEQPELVKVKPKLFEKPEKVAEVKTEKPEKLAALDKVERKATSEFKQDKLFEPKQKPLYQAKKYDKEGLEGGKKDALYSPKKRDKAKHRLKESKRQVFSQILRKDGFDGTDTIRLLSRITKERKVLNRIVQNFGATVEFFDSKSKKVNQINGVVLSELPDTIFINKHSTNPLLVTVGHELTHTIEHRHPDIYEFLIDSMRDNTLDFQGYIDQLNLDYGTFQAEREVTEDFALKEFVGDFVGQQLTEKSFYEKLYDKSPSLAKRLMNLVDKIFSYFKGRTDPGINAYVADLDLAQRVVAEVLGEVYAKESGLSSKKTAPLYQFAGIGARTSDKSSLMKAHGLQNQGKDMEAVRKETGWFLDVDNKWKFEIDDSAVRVRDKGKGEWTALGDAIKHTKLFQAYPQLKDVQLKLTIDEDLKAPSGSLNSASIGTWTAAGTEYETKHSDWEIFVKAPNMEDAKSTLLHEVQHAIQVIEGFARGGSPAGIKTELSKSAGLDADKIRHLAQNLEELKKSDAMKKENDAYLKAGVTDEALKKETIPM